MKISILADAYMPRWDGVSRFLVEVIERLKEKHTLQALVPDYGPSSNPIPVRKVGLMRLQVNDYRFARFPSGVRSFIADSDLVFVNSLGPIGMMGLIHGKRARVPVVTYVHAIDWDMWSSSIGRWKKFFRMLFRFYTRVLYNRSSMIIVPYPEVIDLLKSNHIHKPDFAVVRLGVDTTKFAPVSLSAQQELRKRYNLDPHKRVLGYIGRISREKGITTLLRAFSQLRRDYPDVQLVVAGKGIPELIALLRAERGVVYIDLDGDSKELMQAIDIFVLPSLTETTSLCTLEAMACGKVAIASSVGYIKQYIEDKENGFLFNRENASQLHLKMKYVLEHFSELDDLRKKARATVVHRFNWDSTAKHLMDVFSEYA